MFAGTSPKEPLMNQLQCVAVCCGVLQCVAVAKTHGMFILQLSLFSSPKRATWESVADLQKERPAREDMTWAFATATHCNTLQHTA